MPGRATRRANITWRRSTGRCAGPKSASRPTPGRTINRFSASSRAAPTIDLRAHCAEKLIELDLPGYAVGGLAVGEGFEAMMNVLSFTTPLLPVDKPRYLMGVGFPQDIVAAVAAGIDMFDCVMPTRNGRNAYAFTAAGPIRIKNSQFRRGSGPDGGRLRLLRLPDVFPRGDPAFLFRR